MSTKSTDLVDRVAPLPSLGIQKTPITKPAVRLKLRRLGLIGREKEVALLEDAYHRVKGKDAPAQVVLVHGVSGSGKTTIVIKFQQRIRDDESYYVSGKFDQQVNAKPFSALVDALTDLCDILMRSPDREEYKKRILESLRDEWTTLARAIPNLAKLLGQDESKLKGESGTHHAHALIRLKTLFRSLLRSLSTEDRPIVVFLDDLQFSDEASVDLIDSLLIDKELCNFLFISAYRDDEVTPVMEKVLNNKAFQSIGVGGFSVECINDLLAKVTELPCKETLSLAEVIFRKTRGNIFFVLQFLRVAQDKGLLLFSLKTYRWTWDVRKIDTEMNVSSNVVDLVVDRLHGFPENVQVLLNIASCLGASFNATLLAILYERKDEEVERTGLSAVAPMEVETENGEDHVCEMLQMAVEQELVTTGDEQQYMFSHDRMQQGSYLLIEEGREKRLLELRVGLQLLRLFHSSESQSWMLFSAVNSLNRSMELLSAEERLELARLNLETAKKAKQESAFLLSAVYLRKGIELFDEQKKWNDYYKLTLEMYTLSAEMEYTGGNLKKAEQMTADLIKSGNVHDEDKIPLYFTRMLAAGDQVKLDLALDVGIDGLSRLGVSLPRKPTRLQMMWYLAKTERMLKGITDDELLSLPQMEDEKKKQAMSFLRPMLIYAWAMGADVLLTIIFMKEMRLSLRYGACETTPSAFTSYGMLMTILGNSGESFRFAALAERLLEADKEGTVGAQAFVMCVAHATCLHWRRPIVNSTEPLLEGHRIGMMKSGDVEWACLCIAVYSGVYIHAGLPLSPFVSDSRKFIQVMRDCDQHISVIYSLVAWQFALNLMGRSNDPLVLTGEAMDEEETMRQLRETNQKTGLFITTLHLLQLTYIFGEFDRARAHARELWTLRADTYKGHLVWNWAMFFSGLAELAYARQKHHKRLPRQAMKFHKTLAGYEQEGGVNQYPMRVLLDAEVKSIVSKDSEEVRKAFDQAISASQRCGLTHFAAIANERAALYMLDQGDLFWGRAYMLDAKDCYRRWGASAKTAHLQARFKSLFVADEQSNSVFQRHSVHLRGSERCSMLPMSGDLSTDY